MFDDLFDCVHAALVMMEVKSYRAADSERLRVIFNGEVVHGDVARVSISLLYNVIFPPTKQERDRVIVLFSFTSTNLPPLKKRTPSCCNTVG